LAAARCSVCLRTVELGEISLHARRQDQAFYRADARKSLPPENEP